MDENAKIIQLRSDLASLVAQGGQMAQRSVAGTLTAEESASFDEHMKRVQTCQAELEAEVNRFKDAKSLLTLNDKYNKPADSRGNGISLDTRTDPRDGGGWDKLTTGQKFIASEEFESARKLGQERDMKPVQVGGFFPTKSGADWTDGLKPEEIRALIYSATPAASALLPQVLPTIYRANEIAFNMRDVLLNFTTQSDSITVMQESGYTTAAVEVAEATLVSNGAKPESALTFTEASFPVRWIAHWIPITRQMLEDLAFMRGYVDQRLLTGLARREDAEILNGDGIAPNITGLLATSGIQVLDATYFTGAPVQNAATTNENLNRIRRAKTKIATTGAATATFVVVNPAVTETWDTIADANRQYLLGGPLMPAARTIWGLPVVESENIAATTALVGDGTMAAVVDRMQGQIFTTDSHSDYFIRNIFVILAEERIALPVFRPVAFAKVTLI